MLPNGFRDKIIYSISILLSRFINRGKNPQDMDFKTILIIRQDEIGDLCYSTPAFELIRHRYPSAKISLWCKSFAVSLVKNDPNLDKVFSDKKNLEKKYDLIVDLRGGWQGIGYALMHVPKYRIERGITRLRNKRKGVHPHELLTTFEVIQPLLKAENHLTEPKIYSSDDDQHEAKKFLDDNKIKRFAVLHTGARRILRIWPENNFVTLANYLKENYKLDIVFIGDSNDINAINNIQSKIPFPTFSSAGILSLSALAAFISKADLYVGNESGPLHIAALCDVPCLGLFGPGEPHVFYPYGKKSKVLHHILPCNPCNQITCVHPDNPCIQRITITEVKDIISQFSL